MNKLLNEQKEDQIDLPESVIQTVDTEEDIGVPIVEIIPDDEIIRIVKPEDNAAAAISDDDDDDDTDDNDDYDDNNNKKSNDDDEINLSKQQTATLSPTAITASMNHHHPYSHQHESDATSPKGTATSSNLNLNGVDDVTINHRVSKVRSKKEIR